MHVRATGFADLDDTARREALSAAARALRDGRLVIAPTETVYGVFASAASPAGVGRLIEETGEGAADEPRFTWHAPDAEAIARHVELPTPVHRRLIARLLPGPVRFVLEQSGPAVARLRRELGVEPGVIDLEIGDGGGAEVALRVPGHVIARELARVAGVPLIAERLGRTRWGETDRSNTAIGDVSMFDGAVLDVGPLPPAPPSTTVRLALSGAIRVNDAGTLKEADVLDALRRRIVFVCTGNTCRSPMAGAIARELLAEHDSAIDHGVEIIIETAGVATGDGMPASPEAVSVIAERGGDLRAHRSRRLTRETILRAERVYAMTAGHLERALDLAPEAADRMELLDPAGADIPDPIGGPVDVYRQTAARIREAVAQRFEELGL